MPEKTSYGDATRRLTMRRFTLKVHQSNFSEESLVINAKDFPDIKRDDIVKISSCDGDPNNHLVMKVKSLKKEGELQKNAVSIEQTLAQRFNMHAFQSVYVMKVDPVDISLDMMEVMFKEQYVSRSDMWRLKRHLVGSCTCVNEKVEFCDIRAQVNELWINGSKVKCGLVTDSTRIVLRSATALVYIFIQMSREMWDFDAYGQLQFEKAVDGFLRDLFAKWKEKCYHEFTLVTFSRSFYDASKLEQFPDEVRHVVQKDYSGRLYIDFYYCVAHHERSEDCSPLLFRLKRLFNDYKSLVHIPSCPPCSNSSASDGNFLEAINMSLNVFEKHYVDRNFDRTGQLVLCITPGVGVFDVDRDLTILTKERMIDNGIGSDLVCLGQEPLHSIPLFKFHHSSNGKPSQKEMPHSFNIPHWINHSFYSPNPFLDKGTVGIKHVPRVTFSLKKDKISWKRSIQTFNQSEKSLQCDLPSLLTHDAEEFDDEIFGLLRASYSHQIQSKLPIDKRNILDARKNIKGRVRTTSDSFKQPHMLSQTSSNPLHIPKQLLLSHSEAREARSLGPSSNLDKYFAKQEKEPNGIFVGSAHSFYTYFSKRQQHFPQRALINPFIKSNTMQPVTSNRRRWVHTHPIPQPSFPTSEKVSGRLAEYYVEERGSDIDLSLGNSSIQQSSRSLTGSANSGEFSGDDKRCFGNFVQMVPGMCTQKNSLTSPAVNWKSLRSPACLPITNDYFPSKLCLDNEYTEQSYNLIPDHEDGPFGQSSDYFLSATDAEQGSSYQGPQHMTAREVFLELVNQRLCQGFQLVVSGLPSHRTHYDSLTMSSGRRSPVSLRKDISFASAESSSPVCTQFSGSIATPESAEAYTLNHGRQYHVVSLTGENTILVKIYKPRHPFLTSTIGYKYLLWAVGRDRFRVANVKFAHEQYEHYHWSYQDNCVCFGGADSEYKITESIKYWRAKFFVIPSHLNKLRQQKSETETAHKENRTPRYDIFSLDLPTNDNICKVYDGMLKFFDNINKVRRTPHLAQQHLPQLKSGKVGIVPSTSMNTLSSSTPFTPSHAMQTCQVMNYRCDVDGVDILEHQPDSDLIKMGQHDISEPQAVPRTLSISERKVEQDEMLVRKIACAMRDEESGLNFLQHQGRLLNYSFLSADAVNWCLKRGFGLKGIEEVVSLFEKMRRMKYICHASWNFDHPFLYGYFIFQLVPDGVCLAENDINRNFESEWLELEMKLKENSICEANVETSKKKKPRSALSTQLEGVSTFQFRQYGGLSNMKTVLIPLNNKHKTGRSEWCQVQHPASIMPLRGSATFSFSVQWMVATATCLFEMLHSWLREANRCGLCMIPSPDNPFAFPHTEKDASPLHCPLFVPLNLEKLSLILPAFKGVVTDETMKCRERIIDFMENIALRFGFQSYHVPVDDVAERTNAVNSRHFVHYTGQVFLEIPVTKELRVQGRTVANRKHYYNWKFGEELYESLVESGNTPKDFISASSSKNAIFKRSESMVNLKDCGFYFSVNHMLTKRWRLPSCDDCPTSELEADFIEFCSCNDGRLTLLYESIFS